MCGGLAINRKALIYGAPLFQLFVTVWADIDNKNPKIKKLSTLKVQKNHL